MTGQRAGALVYLALLGTCGMVTLGGCAKKGIASELQLFKDSGRAVSEFSELAAGPLGAQTCQTGTIDNIATLLCEYQSADAASQGQIAVEGWFAQTSTALVMRRNVLLLGLADRNNIDPSGKSISVIERQFRRIGKR